MPETVQGKESAANFLSRHQISYDGQTNGPADSEELLKGMIDLNSLRRIDEESGDLIDIIYEPAPAPISPINSGTWSFPQIQKMNKLQQKYLNMAHAGELDAVHAVADQLTAIRGRLGYGAFLPMSDFAIVAEGRDRRAKLAQWLIGEMSNDPPTPGSAGPFFFSAKGFIELKAYAAAN